MAERQIFPFVEYKKQLTDRIAFAKANAMDCEDFWQMHEREQQELQAILTGGEEVHRVKYNQTYDAVLSHSAFLLFKNPHEFLYAANLLNIDIEVVEHELAHWRVSVDQGFADSLVGFVFIKYPDRISRYPHPQPLEIDGKIPEDMTSDEFRKALRRIALAPKKPSVSDRELFL